MRPAGNFHPEWGYLAPAPSFMRTVRVALVATAIGAVAGGVVVVSLVERPGSNEDTAIATHALLTRVPVISRAATPGAVVPAGAKSTAPAAQPKPQLSIATAAAPLAPSAAAKPAPAVQSTTDLASADRPNKADSISPPLPLPKPTDATMSVSAPVADLARVPAEADVAVAPDTAAEQRPPAKKSSAKRHRYETYRRQETTRSRWRENRGFGPLFRLFSFRTGSAYSAN